MTKIMPSLKARPEWMPWALECVRDNAGNHKKMQDCIVARWHRVSQRTKLPSARNALRAVFGPTLRHLQLITGNGDSIELLSKGKELLKAHERQGESSFRRALARHLVKLEKERWVPVLLTLKKANGPIHADRLVANLSSTYNTPVSLDKLRKILLYYSYVGLVNLEGRTVTLYQKQLNTLLKDIDIKLSETEFRQALIAAYERIASPTEGSSYVPIPDLREAVCESTGMWQDDFYRMLQEMPKESPDYLVHLSQPMLRKPGGITIGGKYFYYVAIYVK